MVGGRGKMRVSSNGYWVSFQGDKNILKSVMMVTQSCEYDKTLNCAGFMVPEFCPNLKVISTTINAVNTGFPK